MRALISFTRIFFAIFKFGLDQMVLPKFLSISFWFIPTFWFKKNRDNNAERFRGFLEYLGPVFVKFGQLLSTREDLLPLSYIKQLALLQDRVAPFPNKTVVSIIEKSIGCSIGKVFTNFSKESIASASVAQVHSASLLNGEKIVIKVLRPKIAKIIASDISLMYLFVGIVQLLLFGDKKLNLKEVVAEFEHSITNELDLVREAGNSSQIRRSFAGSKLLYVPKVYWQYSSKNILVMERVHGINVNDIKKLRDANVNMKRLAEIGVEIFFSQVFRDRFFHADMHPGNLFIDISDIDNPKYIAVDFGIVGSLSEVDQRYIADNFLAFFNRDYGKVASLHVDSGWVPAKIRIDQFEMDIRSVCEPVFEKKLHEINFGKFLFNLFQTARKYNMTVQPQLILLQKTLICIESMGRKLYPELDIWSCAKPILEKWVNERMGVKTALIKSKNQIPYILEKMPVIPEMIINILEKAQPHYTSNQDMLQTSPKSVNKAKFFIMSFTVGVMCATIFMYIMAF